MLDGLHAEKGGEEIRAAGHHAVIGHEDGVVVGNVGLEGGGQLAGAGRAVARQRHLSQSHHHFREQGLIEGAAGGRKTRGGRGMGVADGLHVGAQAVNEQMHGQLGGNLPRAAQRMSLGIGDDQIVGREHAFVHARGRGQDAPGVEAHGEIAFAGDDEAAVVHPAADGADVVAVLFFGFGLAL